MRTTVFNLKDGGNPDFRGRVAAGVIPPEAAAAMTAEDMASDKARGHYARVRKEMAAEAVRGQAEMATTDQFQWVARAYALACYCLARLLACVCAAPPRAAPRGCLLAAPAPDRPPPLARRCGKCKQRKVTYYVSRIPATRDGAVLRGGRRLGGGGGGGGACTAPPARPQQRCGV